MVANLCLESWQALHQRLRGIAKRRAALDAEEARCLREADALRLWRRLGYVHMAEYLEREMGYSPQTGAERMRVARELGELPQLEASLADGILAYSAVRELTRIATTDTEDEWLTEARGKTVRQIEAMVSGRKHGDRPSDPTDPNLVNRVVRIELSPEVFALFRQTQSALADERGERLDDNAFVEVLCRRALEGTAASERPAHQIAITLCESCKRGWQNGAGREIEVGPDVIARAHCDAELLGSLDATQPARVTTTVTPRIRRHVLARDHHRCTVPGCRSARNIDLHHIEYQSHGGTHELSNITAICSGHHAQLHGGALTIRGSAPDALEFVWNNIAAGSSEVNAAERATPGPVAAAAGALDGEHVVSQPTAREKAPIGSGTPDARVVVESAPAVGEPMSPPAIRDVHDAHVVAAYAAHEQRTAAAETANPHVGDSGPSPQVIRDAREALTTAGYKSHEARTAVEAARARIGDHAPLPALLREALRWCARPGTA
jgi:hypothetical protein